MALGLNRTAEVRATLRCDAPLASCQDALLGLRGVTRRQMLALRGRGEFDERCRPPTWGRCPPKAEVTSSNLVGRARFQSLTEWYPARSLVAEAPRKQRQGGNWTFCRIPVGTRVHLRCDPQEQVGYALCSQLLESLRYKHLSTWQYSSRATRRCGCTLRLDGFDRQWQCAGKRLS
jgi:hypothetical protein